MSNAALEAAIEAAWDSRDAITPATTGETREAIEDTLDVLVPLSWLFVFYSIVQQTTLNRALESEERFHTLLDSLNDVVWSYENPQDGVARIKDHLAFYTNGDVTVEHDVADLRIAVHDPPRQIVREHERRDLVADLVGRGGDLRRVLGVGRVGERHLEVVVAVEGQGHIGPLTNGGGQCADVGPEGDLSTNDYLASADGLGEVDLMANFGDEILPAV